MKEVKSLMAYGDKIQVGAIGLDTSIIPMPKFEPEKPDPEKESLKNFLDSILPPKKIIENDLIFYRFVSCDSAIVNDVIKLSHNLDNQLKIRGAKEKGICPIREELYFECFEELIREVTIVCMQRGDLLNRLKLEMNYTLNYYRKLYESLIASTIRKELIEKKKIIKLQNKYKSLEDEINDLENEINEKEQLFLKREKEENEKEEQASIDHNEAMKVLKFDNENKTNQAIKILTTPKEEIILGK
jgi:dynein light intermediate chain